MLLSTTLLCQPVTSDLATSVKEAIRAILVIPAKITFQHQFSNVSYVTFGPLIMTLINLSVSQGKFPTMLKVGQVILLSKKPGISADDVSNYRPITNLNTVEKNLEYLALK